MGVRSAVKVSWMTALAGQSNSEGGPVEEGDFPGCRSAGKDRRWAVAQRRESWTYISDAG